MHKDIEKILYSEQDIKNIVKRLAKEVEKDYNGKDFIMVGLLKGCVSFTSKPPGLVRGFQMPARNSLMPLSASCLAVLITCSSVSALQGPALMTK